eukprot:TRINITY_DN302_c0_g1_i1.p1 TRINITY_DN302_c0_g1~~TRINITY_DN302_c0_g1_i1.p1  ORF type:complete len:449 (+),score=125.77 TRINITY_DN302_c0_g1_i1:520-1866(+)
MALQNIGASNQDDAFYRYKMPKLITKIEGRGNGIKTNIVNMVDVAKALGRPPSYTTKYFGCELGAQSKFDEKTGTSTVNGSHDNAKMVALLENFIKKYVQCYGCQNPETEIEISKSGLISLRCAACGYRSDVDMRDKLTTFILKNPPEQKGGKGKKAMRRAEKERIKQGEALDEEQKKAKKEAKKKKAQDANAKGGKKKSSDEEDNHSPHASQHSDADNADDDVHWQTDTSAEAAKQRIKEQLTYATSEMVMLDILDETKKKPEKQNLSIKTNPKEDVGAKLTTGSGKVSTKDSECNDVNAHEELVASFEEFLSKGRSVNELPDFMTSFSEAPQQVMTALFESLFKGVGKGLSKDVSEKKAYLKKAVQNGACQLYLLSAMDAFCKKGNVDAAKEVALVLKVLYDAEILEEENVIQWYDTYEDKSSVVWKNAKPFVEWLKNAESESEEE